MQFVSVLIYKIPVYLNIQNKPDDIITIFIRLLSSMRNYLKYCTFIIALLFTAAGCKKDDVQKPKEESELVQKTIAGVNGPTTGLINQELVFNVVWQNADSTTRFHHLQDSTNHNTKLIRLFALTNVADTTAVAGAGMKTVPYVFKVATPGVYYLKFYKEDNAEKTAIIDTIHISSK